MNHLAHNDIYAMVRQIPAGRVATYGQVAALAGLPGHARSVGYALRHLDAARTDVPWHRVVNARGEISYSASRGGADAWQKALLEDEGVIFDAAGKINLHEFLWEEAKAV